MISFNKNNRIESSSYHKKKKKKTQKKKKKNTQKKKTKKREQPKFCTYIFSSALNKKEIEKKQKQDETILEFPCNFRSNHK